VDFHGSHNGQTLDVVGVCVNRIATVRTLVSTSWPSQIRARSTKESPPTTRTTSALIGPGTSSLASVGRETAINK
jgi:hypothetical protein